MILLSRAKGTGERRERPLPLHRHSQLLFVVEVELSSEQNIISGQRNVNTLANPEKYVVATWIFLRSTHLKPTSQEGIADTMISTTMILSLSKGEEETAVTKDD